MRERARRPALSPTPTPGRPSPTVVRQKRILGGGAEAPERCTGLWAALTFNVQPDNPPRPRGVGDRLAGKRSANLIGTARSPLTFVAFFLVFGSAFGGGFTFKRSVTAS